MILFCQKNLPLLLEIGNLWPESPSSLFHLYIAISQEMKVLCVANTP